MTTNDTADPAATFHHDGRAADAEEDVEDGSGQHTMMVRCNGAAVYAAGANKVPMDLMDGRLTAAGHRRLVQSASEANFKMLRIWGGAGNIILARRFVLKTDHLPRQARANHRKR